MPQSFFLVRLSGIEGPMTFSKVLDCYYDGQIHDSTPVWDSVYRRWYQFAELKLPLVRMLQPETVISQKHGPTVRAAVDVDKAKRDRRR